MRSNMDKTPPPSERARIRRLREYAILDTLPEVDFDNITRIASAICQTPIALISLVDVDRQWFKSAIGLTERETPLEASFCAHAIQDPSHVLTVTDATLDSRFSETPLVTGSLGIRFYSGVPLVDAEGYALGTLCIIDQKPRQALTEEQEESLKALASQVMRLLELRLRNREIQAVSERLMEKNDELHQFALTLSHDIKSPLAGIQQLAELIQENMPKEANPKVDFKILFTRTEYTKEQYRSSMLAMIEGAVLAVVVVFLFLRDWRATIISAIAIPLSDDVLSILNYLRERQVQKVMSNDPEHWANSKKLPSPGQYVFPGRWPTKPQTQPSLNRAMRRFYDDYVKDSDRVEEESLLRVADGYPRPTVHDLRRTATTHMSKHGLGKEVRSRILNHKDLSVDAIYDRYAYFEEKAEALQGWHAYLKGLLQKEFGDVDWVEFYGRRMEAVTPSEDNEE